MQALTGIPEVRAGDDTAEFIRDALVRLGIALQDGDILAVAHKMVSKAEGRMLSLRDVSPGAEARALAKDLQKDARKLEVILQESRRMIRTRDGREGREGLVISEHRLGFICANGAVDQSNVPDEDTVILLPKDPDASARALRSRLHEWTGVRVGVVVSDTFGRPWRRGLVNVAIGLAGVPACVDLRGRPDASGRTLRATMPALADEVAAAAGLLMAKNAQVPVVLVRGLAWDETVSSGRDLLRPEEDDLFR
jgi:coenzyme F420-0:L-glutamate ligase/coenzyme F420-1:gamma-L-glutamate ligase